MVKRRLVRCSWDLIETRKVFIDRIIFKAVPLGFSSLYCLCQYDGISDILEKREKSELKMEKSNLMD